MAKSTNPGEDQEREPFSARLRRLVVSARRHIRTDAHTSQPDARPAKLSWAAVARLWVALQHARSAFSALYFVAPALRPRRVPFSPRRRSRAAAPPLVRIVANPAGGGMHGELGLRDLKETVEWLGEHGLPAELCLTDGPGSARSLAEEAVRAERRMVVAAGGDGTINEVIQALAGHTTALGVLPSGTVNVWAREMNIPLTLAGARRVLLDGVRRRIDLGRAGARYFLLMAGVGIDAEVTSRVERHFLRHIGWKVLDYIATGGLVSVTQRPVRIWVEQGNKRRSRHAVQIVIGNTRLFAGAFAFTQRAVSDDGLLDVVFVGGRRLRHRVHVVLRAALRRPSLGPHAHYERVRAIRLESEAPMPVQVDGEVIGHLPMTFAVVPRALTVLVPRDAPADLFVHPPLAD